MDLEEEGKSCGQGCAARLLAGQPRLNLDVLLEMEVATTSCNRDEEGTPQPISPISTTYSYSPVDPFPGRGHLQGHLNNAIFLKSICPASLQQPDPRQDQKSCGKEGLLKGFEVNIWM